MRSPVERFFERVLPWFDEDHEAKRDARTARILMDAEAVRQAYVAAARTPFIDRRKRPR